MYIEPNTTIKILKDIPLDTTYQHTIWWDMGGAQSQAAYFSSKAKYTLDRQSYQRVKRGYMRVNVNAENLYDCNYLMFQNTAFGNKWFYAFITSAEYVNNNVAEISFEIDDMQTWHFDYAMQLSFVEREHSLTDNIGDNLIPENLELGDYVSEDMTGTGYFTNWKIVLVNCADTAITPVEGGFYGKAYQQAEFRKYPATAQGVQLVQQKLEQLKIFGAYNTVLGIYMMPDAMVATPGTDIDTGTFPSLRFYKPKAYTNIDGYVPKNNKLFTHPYNFLKCSNMDGQTYEYHYEYFEDIVGGEPGQCNFYLTADTSVDPTAVLIPCGYKGLLSNVSERMNWKGFPKCCFATNDFGAKLVQAGIWAALTAITGGIGGAVAPAITKTIINETKTERIGRGPQYKTVTATEKTSEYTPPTREGGNTGAIVSAMGMKMLHPHVSTTQGDNIALVNLGYGDFIFEKMHIRAEFARCIDDYFTMFGYQTNRVKVPNRNSRPHFNYVKTINCVITGSMPADAERHICQIYDNGITFWKNPAEVGNYNLPNSPV